MFTGVAASHTGARPAVPQRSAQHLSFFDDGEETQPRPSSPTPRQSAAAPPQRPSPRRPQGAGGSLGIDQHTLMVRRRAAVGIAVVLVIVIALVINGCLKSEAQQSLKEYAK